MLAEFRYSSLREAVAAFEKLGLFDGMVIQPTRVLNGESVSNPQNAFSSKPWQWKEFANALADLQPANLLKRYATMSPNA